MKKITVAGNRTVVGVICIVLAFGITFGIAPLVNKFTDRKVDIVQMRNNVERGHIITPDDISVVSVSAYNLSRKIVTDPDTVVGKYAATKLYAEQHVMSDQIVLESKSADDVLDALDGTKVAISVNINSFAQGVSDKIKNGDIISVIIYDKVSNQSFTPAELKYVKVITTTTGEGIDCDEKTGNVQAATITLLVSPAQAELLAHYNSVTTLHFTLMCRGDTAIANDFLKVQEEYLNTHTGEAIQPEDTNG